MTRIERDALKDANARLDVDNKRMARELKRVTSSVDADAAESTPIAKRSSDDAIDSAATSRMRSSRWRCSPPRARCTTRWPPPSTGSPSAPRRREGAAGAVSEAKILRQEKTTLSSQLESRRHQCELLQQDKAPVGEVESARERERRWEEEEDRLREKARALRDAGG